MDRLLPVEGPQTDDTFMFGLSATLSLLLALSFVVAGTILRVLHVTVPPALPTNSHKLFQAKCHLSDTARKHLSESRESYLERRVDTELRWYSSARYSGFEGMHGVVLGVPDVPEEGVFDQNKGDPSSSVYGTRDGVRIWPAVEREWPFLRARVPASRIIHCVNVTTRPLFFGDCLLRHLQNPRSSTAPAVVGDLLARHGGLDPAIRGMSHRT